MKRPTCLVLRGLRAENLADGHFLEEGLRGEATLLERKLAEMALLIGLLEDVLLHGALAHQPVDVHVARLPDAVRAVLRLRVHRRVPVRVVEDHRVGAHQIDAQTARPRAEDEDEHLSVVVELLHHLLALGERRGAVHSQIREVVHVQKRLEDVQHPRHLRKQQTAMAFLTQTRKHIAQHLQLPAVELDQTLLRKLHAVKRRPRVDRRSISHPRGNPTESRTRDETTRRTRAARHPSPPIGFASRGLGDADAREPPEPYSSPRSPSHAHKPRGNREPGRSARA